MITDNIYLCVYITDLYSLSSEPMSENEFDDEESWDDVLDEDFDSSKES